MYFAMDEIGFENAEKIKTINAKSDRWRFIYDTAEAYGFDGIHITPPLYKEFGLDVCDVPGYFRDFKLTFHLGGIYKVASKNEYEAFNRDLEIGFDVAVKHSMHDMSIHPPYIHKLTKLEKDSSLEYLHRAIEKWVKAATKCDISLSLETHVAGEWFLFNGLNEFADFVDMYPDLGVLIDISHNYYGPPHSEDDIINILGNKNIKGLHISDALRSADFETGTHLAIGDGTINFPKLLKYFEKFPALYAALEIKANNEGICKSLRNLKSFSIKNRQSI